MEVVATAVFFLPWAFVERTHDELEAEFVVATGSQAGESGDEMSAKTVGVK